MGRKTPASAGVALQVEKDGDSSEALILSSNRSGGI